jgi:hypothetical protein
MNPRGGNPAARAILAGAVIVAISSAAPSMPGSASVMNETKGARVAVVDLSFPVDIADGECSFGPRLEHALDSLIVHEGSTPVARAGRVNLAGQRMTASLTSERDQGVDSPDIPNLDATVRLAPAARWHGLRLTGLRRSTGWAFAASSLEFSDSPARVQAALRRMGIAIPLPPALRDIPTDECSASIAIDTRPHGSALTCSSAC